jgi:DNA-binding MarR family transcriptional regulator
MTSAGPAVRDGEVQGPWLDEREMAAWRSFAETVHDLLRALELDLANHRLTLGDYQVLVELSEAGERAMRMCDLAATLQLTPSGLTRRLDGLVRAGDVERVPAVHDRRVMLARLTEQGMARLVAAAPTHAASVRARFLDPVDPADQDALGRAFTAIRAALRSR